MSALATAVVVAACGSGGSTPMPRALRLWSHFQVDSNPRPVVMSPEVGPGAVLRPDDGFPTGRTSLAFSAARFELATSLPQAPARRDGYPIIDAARAMQLLLGSGKPLGKTAGPPLRITGLSLGTAPFLTDRGWLNLPAWQFHLAGVSSPAAVLAVGGSGLFNQPRLVAPTHHGFESYPDSATVSVDGKTLTIGFVGAHSGNKPCDASYSAIATQSTQAVAVQLYQHLAPEPAGATCDLVGYERTVKVHLSRPLGARVLINATNAGAIPAYPPGTRLGLLVPPSGVSRHQPRFP
jgi:hypothetical protein